MNKQHVTLLVLLDLSAAFDTVGGRAFESFRSYLSGRCQRISVRGCQSESFNLNCGVPQGSCLRPLLFNIYTSSLLDVIQDYLPSVHCFGDDTQLYISFTPADETGHSDAIGAIELYIQVIRNWMHDNKLLLNEDKTEFLLIGIKQQLAKVNISHVTVGKANIAPQSPVKNLGVWLDSNLSVVDHITKTSSAAFYHLYNIRRIRRFLTKECTETRIHAFISSRLDYCNSLLFGVPERHLQKLQRVQNAAARFIFQESRYCHITPLLKSLHWLPVRYRIVFKILLITFKAVHGLAPAYISELVSIRESAGRHYLPFNNGLRLNYSPCKSLATLRDRSFRVAAPKLWNHLPIEIRNMTSVQNFLKIFIFKSFLIVHFFL